MPPYTSKVISDQELANIFAHLQSRPKGTQGKDIRRCISKSWRRRHNARLKVCATETIWNGKSSSSNAQTDHRL